MKPLPIAISVNDISLEAAINAHRWSSMVPEKRGKQVRDDYVRHMEALWQVLEPLVNSPEKEVLIKEELQRYKSSYISKYLSVLHSRSRTASSMVTGGSNFNVSRNQKALNSEQRKVSEFWDWQGYAETSIIKKLKKLDIQEAGGELEVLKQEIAKAEKLQEDMKRANAILRKKDLSKEEKISQVAKECGLQEFTVQKFLESDFADRIGYPDYRLRNNSSNIKRMKERLASMEKTEATSTTEVPFPGGRVVDNQEADRIQIFFDVKPEYEMRSKLKSHGFRWSPSNGTWQRFRTNSTRYAIRDILGVKI